MGRFSPARGGAGRTAAAMPTPEACVAAGSIASSIAKQVERLDALPAS